MKNLNSKVKQSLLISTYIIVLSYILLNLSTVGNFLKWSLNISAPFLMAIGISFVLNIPMRIIENKLLTPISKIKNFKFLTSLKRPLSIVITLLLVIGLLSTLVIFIIPQLLDSVSKLVDSVPQYIQSFENIVLKNLGNIDGFDSIWSTFMNAWKDILGVASQVLGFTLNHILNLTMSITSGIFNFLLALVFSIYMLSNKEKLIFQCKKFIYAHLKDNHADKILEIGRISNETFQKFIGGQCIEAVIIGTLCFIGMFILRLPYPLLIGFVVGVTSLIPIFGAFIGTIPSAFIILIISPIKAVIFIIFIIVLQQFEGHLIYPKVVGNSIGLSSIWVMFAMLIGGSLFGFLGFLLGIPLFGVIYKITRKNTNRKLAEKGLSISDINNK